MSRLRSSFRATLPPEISRTCSAHGSYPPSGVGLVLPERRAAVGRGRHEPRSAAAGARARACQPADVVRPLQPHRERRHRQDHVLVQQRHERGRCRSARTRRRSGPAAPAASASTGRRATSPVSSAASVARARCSALLTDATVVSSSSATSAACQRSTSRRISTARCRAGRCCRAATNASRIDSRVAGHARPGRRPAGAPRASGDRLRPSASSGSAAPSDAPRRSTPGPRSIGRARRCRPRSMSRQTLVAIRYSQERSDERPSKRSTARQARTIVSCTASSASKPEPSIR